MKRTAGLCRAWEKISGPAFLFGLSIILTGCFASIPVSLTTQTDGSVNYARNVTFDVNGVKGYPASTVVPRAATYKIWVHGVGKNNFVILRSCGREISGSRNDSDYYFEYTPLPGVEDNRACPLFFTAAEEGKNRTNWGWMDFQDPRFVLPYTLKCNGQMVKVGGVGVCESGAGLVQQLVFAHRTLIEARDDCKVTTTKDEMTFEFKMPRGTCTFNATDTVTDQTMRLTTFGFDEQQPRNF